MWHPLFHPKRIVAVSKQPQRILANISKKENVQNAMWLFWNNHNGFETFQQLDKTSCGLNMNHNAPKKYFIGGMRSWLPFKSEEMSQFEFWTSTGAS